MGFFSWLFESRQERDYRLMVAANSGDTAARRTLERLDQQTKRLRDPKTGKVLSEREGHDGPGTPGSRIAHVDKNMETLED